MHLLAAHVHRPSIGQYIGPDNRCPVCHTTFALRYLALAHASHVKQRTSATRSCRQVILSEACEKLSDQTLRLLSAEARRLRTVARKMETSHVPAPGSAQRAWRPLPPYHIDSPPQPSERLGCLCVPSVTTSKPDHVSSDADSPVSFALT